MGNRCRTPVRRRIEAWLRTFRPRRVTPPEAAPRTAVYGLCPRHHPLEDLIVRFRQTRRGHDLTVSGFCCHCRTYYRWYGLPQMFVSEAEKEGGKT